MERKLGGMANESGFYVIDFENKLVVASKNRSFKNFASLGKEIDAVCDSIFQRYAYILVSLFVTMVLLLPWLSLAMGNIYDSLPAINGWERLFLAALSSFIAAEIFSLIWLIWRYLRIGLQSKQYHGCEHKVIYLLKRDWTPSIENLQKASRVDSNCGTRLVSLCTIIFPWYALLLQRFITTAEPNLDQLKEGLEVVNGYYKRTKVC